MSTANSPLRYPGGKQVLVKVLRALIVQNCAGRCTYIEPYAGGAGAALTLLFSEDVNRLVLNDADRCIYAFWHSVLNDTERFLRLLNDTPLSVPEWKRHREIHRHAAEHDLLELGFATFFLNRCNRSGIVSNGGIIGGLEQSGPWKLDARFNKVGLTARIEKIASFGDRIKITNLDALRFLIDHVRSRYAYSECFVYLDPPYFDKGSKLYLNFYRRLDHLKLAVYLANEPTFKWAMTYDNVPSIRALYSDFRSFKFDLSYSALTRRTGSEILIVAPNLTVPDTWGRKLPTALLRAV